MAVQSGELRKALPTQNGTSEIDDINESIRGTANFWRGIERA
jgi:hypothetical protein